MGNPSRPLITFSQQIDAAVQAQTEEDEQEEQLQEDVRNDQTKRHYIS